MSVLEYISVFGGVAGVVLSIVAIFVIVILRRNVFDILVNNAVFYEKNYEMRKAAIEASFGVVDYLVEYGSEILDNKNFVIKARTAYNELICRIEDGKIVDKFYNLTLTADRSPITPEDVAAYKAICRKALGYKSPNASYLGAPFKGKSLDKKELANKSKENY